MVGDSCQTLYEFRNADPNALNVLASSNVFSINTLDINYRSNQCILDFANVFLDSMPVNDKSKIRLRANSLANFSVDDFKDRVRLDYIRQASKSLFLNDLYTTITSSRVVDYVQSKLALGQKVAFVAYSRKQVDMIRQGLATVFPNEKIVNITSVRGNTNTIFSRFIRKHQDDLKFIAPHELVVFIEKRLLADLKDNNSDTSTIKSTMKFFNSWRDKYYTTISDWVKAHDNNEITVTQFFDKVKDSMLDFEINNNVIKLNLLSKFNNDIKANASDANLIVSTIHGAKGLEFDNTVVIVNASNNMAQSKLRMYYVALTRAINSEFVLAFDSVAMPNILKEYKQVCSNITE